MIDPLWNFFYETDEAQRSGVFLLAVVVLLPAGHRFCKRTDKRKRGQYDSRA